MLNDDYLAISFVLIQYISRNKKNINPSYIRLLTILYLQRLESVFLPLAIQPDY